MSTRPLVLFRVHFEWNHECLSVCPSGCLSGAFGHLTDFVWLTITFKHCLDMLATMWTNFCHHPSSRLCEGPHRHFLDGLGCLFGAFCPPHLGAAGCAIQPWADFSCLKLLIVVYNTQRLEDRQQKTSNRCSFASDFLVLSSLSYLAVATLPHVFTFVATTSVLRSRWIKPTFMK